jgi:tetratricopeptide (TPR) repeat protein
MDVLNRFRGPATGATFQQLQKSRGLERSGLRHLREGNLLQARADLQRAASLDPSNGSLRGHVAQALYMLDLLSDADREYRAAITHSPVDEDLRYAHAQLLEAMQRLDEAAEEYSFASTLNLQNTRSLAALALLEARRDDLARAEGYLLTALERDEYDAQVWAALHEMRLGVLLEEQRQIDRSIELLAWGYDGSQQDSRIQAAIDRKKPRRRKLTQAIQLYRQCRKLQLLDGQSYHDLELDWLRTHGKGTAAAPWPGSDPWIDLLLDWYSRQQVDTPEAIATGTADRSSSSVGDEPRQTFSAADVAQGPSASPAPPAPNPMPSTNPGSAVAPEGAR